MAGIILRLRQFSGLLSRSRSDSDFDACLLGASLLGWAVPAPAESGQRNHFRRVWRRNSVKKTDSTGRDWDSNPRSHVTRYSRRRSPNPKTQKPKTKTKQNKNKNTKVHPVHSFFFFFSSCHVLCARVLQHDMSLAIHHTLTSDSPAHPSPLSSCLASAAPRSRPFPCSANSSIINVSRHGQGAVCAPFLCRRRLEEPQEKAFKFK